MKAKLLIVITIAGLGLTTGSAFASQQVVETRNGRAVVVRTHRHDAHNSSVFWNVGVGVPFAGGYYGGYPYYGSYYSGYPYGGYPYGYGFGYNTYYTPGYPYAGYGNTYYNSANPYSYSRYSYRSHNDSVVVRVQERLARAGYYRGAIDGVMGPRTRYAIRAYERSHGLPVGGNIDHRLLRTMGLA